MAKNWSNFWISPGVHRGLSAGLQPPTQSLRNGLLQVVGLCLTDRLSHHMEEWGSQKQETFAERSHFRQNWTLSKVPCTACFRITSSNVPSDSFLCAGPNVRYGRNTDYFLEYLIFFHWEFWSIKKKMRRCNTWSKWFLAPGKIRLSILWFQCHWIIFII